MARIPQEEIDRVKREVPIERVVRAAGVELRAHGENLLGLCPMHEDHDPSLVVTPSKALWHCMGACQAGGDVFAWVMKFEKKTFPDAYARLTQECGPAPEESIASPISPAMTDEELMLAVVDYYAERGKERHELQSYLKKRGIDDAEMIAKFRVGYAPQHPGLKLPSNLTVRETRVLRERLQHVGIARAPRGHELFAGSMIVPVFDERGKVAEIYGRKTRDDLKRGTAYHLYLPGPHRGVWNLDALRESKEIILCEAAIDALTFYVHGFRNVTWSYGVEGFSRDHLAAFKAYGTERVLIAYDRDEAGDRAAQKLADRLIAEGITCYRVEFPRGFDANEFARKMTPPGEALALVLRSATILAKSGAVTIMDPPADGGNEDESPSPVSDEPAPPAAPSLVATPVEHHEEIEARPSASPIIAVPRGLDVERRGDEIFIRFGDRLYSIRGMKKVTSFDSLKIGVLLTRESTGAAHLDSFDLSVARQRAQFEHAAAAEIGFKEEVIHRDVGRILLELEQIRRKQIEEAIAPKEAKPVMAESDRAKALALLSDPNLIPRIAHDLTRCGVVGEETNKLLTYIASVSRKLDRPLAVIIQSSSAAGKTTLMDAVLGCMPPEEVVRYSAITGKALFYIPEPDALKHKILAISEEQGAEEAAYALKLLQSEGKLSIASTGKDPHSGRLESQVYHVEGPIMPVMTTTAAEIDEELQNRCIVLTADEDREQTRAIHELQRASQTIEGLLATREANHIQLLHQNAQRLLRPILVANPFADRLTFLDSRTRTRRDHMKYLTLIRTIALLHQYQRPKKTRLLPSGEVVEYIEVTIADIELANSLAHEVLGRSLDELAPQARKLIGFLARMVDAACKRLDMHHEEYRFTGRDIREATGWSDFQVRTHLAKLVALEYVLVHRGGRGQSFVYELLYRGEGESGKPFLVGLIDTAQLRDNYEGSRGHPEHLHAKSEAPTSPRRGAVEPRSSRRKSDGNASADAALSAGATQSTEKTLPGSEAEGAVDRSSKLKFPKPEKTRRYALNPRGGNGRAASLRPSTLNRRVPAEE